MRDRRGADATASAWQSHGVFEVDHLFVCVPKDPPEAQQLRDMGFVVEFKRDHPGQGTCNDLILFARNFLELLQLKDRDEAEANLVRLDRRCDWATTGASPFGIALRGEAADRGQAAWTHYVIPGYLVELWILSQTLEDPKLPLVFMFERKDAQGSDAGPQSSGYPPALFEHTNGASGIAGARVEGPKYTQLSDKLAWPASVQLADASTHAVHLSLESSSARGRVGEHLFLS